MLATYVVDTTGRVRPGSFAVLEASDTAFVSAVAVAVVDATGQLGYCSR